MMPAKSRPEKPGWRNRGLVQAGLLLVLVALFLGSLIWVGWWARDQLYGRDRYLVPFADIECVPPVAMKKQDFLDEVRFEAPHLPERLNLLDDELRHQLLEGFARHRWIEKVGDVQIIPPKRIVVKLTHRTPVLAVKVADAVRAVDGFGILLPEDAPTVGLPVYSGEAKAPQGKAGTRWGDPNVEAAARELKK